MSFKLKLGGDCWKALAGVSTGVIPVEEYLQSRKKKTFLVHNLFTRYIFGNWVKLLSEIAEQF